MTFSPGYVDNLEIELSDAQNEVDWLAGINGELEEELSDAYAEIDRLREGIRRHRDRTLKHGLDCDGTTDEVLWKLLEPNDG